MKTIIHVSRKLEKIILKKITHASRDSENHLGKWNAHVFYIYRKKCWMIINKKSKYALVLTDIKISDLKNISNIFIETLHKQFAFDGIDVDYKKLKEIIGEIKLLSTDNDRKTIGTINDRIIISEYWKKEFGTLENMPIRELNHRLNSLPEKSFNWKSPKEKMYELLDIIK